MDTLERKIKRWKFLNELYNRGIESVGDSKINSILSDKI